MAAEHPEAVPRILGLTGPIACGKTTVGTMLLQTERSPASTPTRSCTSSWNPAPRLPAASSRRSVPV